MKELERRIFGWKKKYLLQRAVPFSLSVSHGQMMLLQETSHSHTDYFISNIVQHLKKQKQKQKILGHCLKYGLDFKEFAILNLGLV